MSRLFEALQHSETETQHPAPRFEFDSVSTPPFDVVEPAAEGLEHSVRISLPAENDLPSLTDQQGISSENFRLLAFRLRQLQENSPFKKVLITSSAVQDGKSLISANLAFTLATREKIKVLLIEGDLRQPRLAQIFGVERLKGLSDWLREQGAISDIIYRLDDYSLWLLPAGQHSFSTIDALHSDTVEKFLQDVSSLFDCIIVDSPPLLPLADAHVWHKCTDKTLLVVREGKTPKKMLEKALEGLERSKLIGAVLNEASIKHDKYYRYYAHPSKSRADAAGVKETQ